MRRKTGGIAVLAGMLAAVAGAVPAQAGIYTVYACNAAGRQWDNRSWELVSPVNNITADQDCAGDSNIGLNQTRSEERRVGKEGRPRWSPQQRKETTTTGQAQAGD